MLKQQLLGLKATMKTKLSRLNKIKLISSLQVKIKLTSKSLFRKSWKKSAKYSDFKIPT